MLARYIPAYRRQQVYVMEVVMVLRFAKYSVFLLNASRTLVPFLKQINNYFIYCKYYCILLLFHFGITPYFCYNIFTVCNRRGLVLGDTFFV